MACDFCTYVKTQERGKLIIRAIFSANILLRMPFRIIEEFHLNLGKKINGSTISVMVKKRKLK